MAKKIPNKDYPIYTFDKTIKELNFRIDTDDAYQIVIVPPTTCTKDFPQRSIVIVGPPSLEKPTYICTVKPGECVKILKVNLIILYLLTKILNFCHFINTSCHT